MKPKVYILGNPLVKDDSLPLKLIPKLKKKLPEIEFEELDTVEEISGKEVNIIDTVLGTKEIKLITDINMLMVEKTSTAHDIDLAMMLKILQKAGKIEKVRIFGIPVGIDEKKALESLTILLKANLL